MYSSVTLNILLCHHHQHPFPELFSFCKTENLNQLNNNASSTSLAPGNNHSTSCQKSFDKSKYRIQVEPHSPFVTGLFHLADCLQGLSML